MPISPFKWYPNWLDMKVWKQPGGMLLPVSMTIGGR